MATLNPVKNQFFLLEIFKEILLKKPKAVLVFIGDGKLKEKLIDYSNKLNIHNNIIFLGLKNNVDEYMQAFDAFVLPSLHEGFGNVLIESQASGLPTIVSKEGVSQEVALTNLISYVSLSKSPEFWANHIINKVNEITRKDNTAKLLKKGFDMESYSSQFEDIYRHL